MVLMQHGQTKAGQNFSRTLSSYDQVQSSEVMAGPPRGRASLGPRESHARYTVRGNSQPREPIPSLAHSQRFSAMGRVL